MMINRRFQVPGITYWFFRERYTNQESLSMASFAFYEKSLEVVHACRT